MTHPRPTQAELTAFLQAEFPQNRCTLEELDEDGSVVVAHQVGASELRPGGTVSGPVMMTLADVALYIAILARIGIVAVGGDDESLHQFPAQAARRPPRRGALPAVEAGQGAGGG